MMSYFLCLKKCFKGCLLRRGYVFKSDILGKYLISLDVRGGPKGEIETFVNGSSILANNDEYDFKGRLIENDYSGIYKTGIDFFFVEQEGQHANLKMVSKDDAEKIYDQMPHKIITNKDVFLPLAEVRKKNVKEILEEAERTRPRREYEEQVRESKKQPYWWITNPWLDDDTAKIIR